MCGWRRCVKSLGAAAVGDWPRAGERGEGRGRSEEPRGLGCAERGREVRRRAV